MPTNFQQKRAERVDSYLKRFPEEGNATLAAAIYKHNKKLFDSPEQIRYMIRYRRGAAGGSIKVLADKTHVRPKGYVKDNPFNIPESSKEDRKPYKLPIANNNILVISDFHIPYHDAEAITAALTYGKQQKVNTIVLLGDILDMHRLSRFEPDPQARDMKHEFDTARAFLVALRKAFPECKIIWVKGNHDERYEKYLYGKCVEIFNDSYFTLEARLGLDNLNIELIDGYTIVKAGKLNMIHGDKLIRGVFAPVNAARGAYLRSKSNTMIAHTHSVSEHSEGNLNNERVSCWSIGCLCELRPKYAPLDTKHLHGFAHVTTEKDGSFQVRNYKIINGKIC